MRYTIALLLALVTWSIPSFAPAQPKPKFEPIAIKKIQVGFRTYKDEADTSAYKAGLWTPIYIEIFGGTDGVDKKPGYDDPFLEITTNDSEDVGTTIKVEPVIVQPLQTRTVVGYVKTGHFTNNGGGEVNVKLHVNGRKVTPQPYAPSFNVNIDAHVYLTLGPRVEDFYRAVKRLGLQGQGGDKEKDFDIRALNNFYNAVYENDVERLPDVWFGYNGIDLMVLTTDKREFLTSLNLPNNAERLKAIAQWVRRGGRLVVPVVPQQDALNALLTNPAAWTPPIPVVPPRVSANIQLASVPVANWGQGEAFRRVDNGLITVATLDPGRVAPGDWDVRVRTDERDGGHPLIATVRYGLGQITFIAFSLQDEHFFAWQAGKEKFLQAMVKELAPKAPAVIQDQQDWRFRNDGRVGMDDPSSQLLVQLDKFGVTVIDFGYVALFIVLYIIIVGPLDFFLLKYVFKRLEWTWITFPAVVLAVSVLAYFAAYFLKGKDLKVNKVDVVDFDLRTSKEQPRVYGHSFFTILSPRIQNYTVGLEPNPEFWGGAAKKPLNVDLLSWMGRPSGGFNGMDRGGSGGFFRNAYHYTDDATGLRGVPIPVWTTKAFMASWEQPLTKAPFEVDLTWHKDKEVKISGKLENHLGVDLVDTWLIFEDRFYPLEGGLKSIKKGAAPAKVNIAANLYETIDKWVFRNDAHDDVPGDAAANGQQTSLMKQMLFHERWDTQRLGRNHLLRSLDLGWRRDEKLVGQRDLRTREAILFARVRPPVGDAEALTDNAQNPLPTKLWLGDIPNDDRKKRPTLSGQLNQDTYIRVLLPLRPEE